MFYFLQVLSFRTFVSHKVAILPLAIKAACLSKSCQHPLLIPPTGWKVRLAASDRCQLQARANKYTKQSSHLNLSKVYTDELIEILKPGLVNNLTLCKKKLRPQDKAPGLLVFLGLCRVVRELVTAHALS